MRTTNILTSPHTPTPSARRQDGITPSRQLGKATQLGAFPTPQSTVGFITPPRKRLPPTSSSTSISSLSNDPSNLSVGDQEVESYLRAHDELRKLYPHDEKVPHSRICVLGAQGAGKSSFLSALTGIDLYCAEKKATCCRTLISSRRGDSPFRADVVIVVVNSRTHQAEALPFATHITDVAEMGKICHWAGEEARRVDGGREAIRPWSILSKISDEEKKYGSENWSDFTKNVVIISAIGPHRPNVDIEDLPGLNGHPIPQNLVTECVSQTQNVVVLCLSAGSSDISSANPEILLARKCDPAGERTIGVLTRADRIEVHPDEESTFVDYLLDVGDHLGGFRPSGQWWPLRLRTSGERIGKVSLNHVRERESELFSGNNWMRIQDKAGRKFGIGELEKKLEEMFSMKVEENIIFLKKSVKESMLSHNDWLSINPTISDPIGELHDTVIYRFAEKLREEINHANQSGQLVHLQTQLELAMQKAVPEFLPFTEDEGEPTCHTSFWTTQGFDTNEEDKIPAEVLLKRINDYTSRRNPDEIDSKAIMQSFQRSYVKRWDEIAKTYVSSLWEEVERLIVETNKEVCGSNQAMKEDIKEKLEELTFNNKKDIIEFIDQMIDLFSSPPGELISAPNLRTTQIRDKAYNHFLKHLNHQSLDHSPNTTGNQENPEMSIPSSPTSTVSRTLHDIITVEDRVKCAKYQAKIGITMMTWAVEFSSIVGKYAQLKVLEYTKKVTPALRKGMGLDEVVEGVKKRAGDMFESDRNKKREREKRIGEVKKLNEIQLHLERIAEM